MRQFKQKIKQIIFNLLSSYGVSVDGIKPAGYISKSELKYRENGFQNLRHYFSHKWDTDVQSKCDRMVAKFLAQRLTGNEKIVEVGTGVGFFTQSLLSRFPDLEYHSFELDKNLSRYLEQDFKQNNFKSFSSDGKHLVGLSNESMDVAVVFGVFTYVNFSNIVQYLQEFQRTLRNGGILFFDMFDTDNLTPALVETFSDYALRGDNRPFMSAKLLEKILVNMGFELLDTEQENSNNLSDTRKMLFEKKHASLHKDIQQ